MRRLMVFRTSCPLRIADGGHNALAFGSSGFSEEPVWMDGSCQLIIIWGYGSWLFSLKEVFINVKVII